MQNLASFISPYRESAIVIIEAQGNARYDPEYRVMFGIETESFQIFHQRPCGSSLAFLAM
jgi:hypothetical protein